VVAFNSQQQQHTKAESKLLLKSCLKKNAFLPAAAEDEQYYQN
jgi:hypothetical protein